MQRFILLALAVIGFPASARGDEVPVKDVRSAIRKSIPWLENGAAGSSRENKCFTCHNHALPVIALVEARQRSFQIDKDNLAAQISHTSAHLQRGRQRYLDGKGQGGQVLTAGYALWALAVADAERSETIESVVTYVLGHQKEKGYWVKNGSRPPSDGSPFTANYVALRAVHVYNSCVNDEAKNIRTAAATNWLMNNVPKDTEDRVFHLKAMSLLRMHDGVAADVRRLVGMQNEDGGWAQKPDMVSDAYATGSAVATLLKEGALTSSDLVIQAGIRYLLNTQSADGTWHVVSRADGFQPYYESGFPYAEDQFISIAATSWATLALLRSLPKLKPK